MQGKNCVTQKLNVSTLAAPQVLGGLSLDACTVRDPRLEVLARRMRWLVSLANLGRIVGVVHRTIATSSSPVYREPSAALQGRGFGDGIASKTSRHVMKQAKTGATPNPGAMRRPISQP